MSASESFWVYTAELSSGVVTHTHAHACVLASVQLERDLMEIGGKWYAHAHACVSVTNIPFTHFFNRVLSLSVGHARAYVTALPSFFYLFK